MKKLLLLTFLYLTSAACFAQKVTGQWRGSFNSNGDLVSSGSASTEYVLELEINGTRVSGSSYSYFEGRRYYVICKLDGIYYKDSKSIKVTETERLRGNTPPDFADCLQVHYLTYEKEGTTEKMVGRWETAPGQRSSCGEGNTVLTRRTLNKDLSSFNKKSTLPGSGKSTLAEKATGSIATKKPPIAKKTPPVTKKPAGEIAVTKPPVTKKPTVSATKPTLPKTATNAKKEPIAIKKAATDTKKLPVNNNTETLKKPDPVAVAPEIKVPEIPEIKSDMNFEKRKSEVLKTIEIENEICKIDLYDNGEVDGDSVSVFYNGKLILSHKRLTDKAISITLPVATPNRVNELTMYAENLGEIAPNTALMVVNDGEKRYEVRISSDLKNSGTIRFVHKPKTQ